MTKVQEMSSTDVQLLKTTLMKQISKMNQVGVVYFYVKNTEKLIHKAGQGKSEIKKWYKNIGNCDYSQNECFWVGIFHQKKL